MLNVVRFWLKKKADGFRLDIVDAIYEDAEFRDNPLSLKFMPSDNSIKRFFRNSKYSLDYPDVFEFREIEKVEIYIDDMDEPKKIFDETEEIKYKSYTFKWLELKCFKHDILIKVFDKTGNQTVDEITIFKWRLHPIIVLSIATVGTIITAAIILQLLEIIS